MITEGTETDNLLNILSTVHTSRTVMFKELSKVMDFSTENDNYRESMERNVFGKKSQDGVRNTSSFLTKLYGFDINFPKFKAFKYFWLGCDEAEKSQLAFILALNKDYLLQESLPVILNCKEGEKVTIVSLMENVERNHPMRFTAKTLESVAQNIASSWKQAGFIMGKVKNIRSQPPISYKIVSFAMFLAYIDGKRGDYILQDNCVSALCLSESKLRELAIEASRRDYLQYQFAGNVTAISFDKLLKNIGIDAI